MKIEELNLIITMEELAEAAQRCSKQLRFGRDEVQPGQDLANHVRLREELLDVRIAIRHLEHWGQILPITELDVKVATDAKLPKIRRMQALSRTLGRLE